VDLPLKNFQCPKGNDTHTKLFSETEDGKYFNSNSKIYRVSELVSTIKIKFR
jgi:hypothetical protein